MDNLGTASNLSNEETHSPKVKRLRLWYLYVILFVVAGLAIFMPAIGMASFLSMLNDWNLHQIGYDLKELLQTENKSPVSAESWCDSLLKMEDDYYSIKRYENQKSEFPYTANKHIFGLESVPDNMVVLYKAEPGWNQVGDVDSVKNQERLLAFLGDGTISFFRKRQIPHLRWKFEDNGVMPAPDVNKQLTFVSISLGIVFLGILLALRRYFKIYWVLALSVGIISAVVGALFGFMAEDAYYKLGTTGDYSAPSTGSIWGFATGVAFIVIIGRIFTKYKSNVSMVGYATVIGAITGVIASSIVHGFLMIEYQERSFSYMLGGSSFGIFAGLLLGWVSSGLIMFYKNKPAIIS